MQFAGRSVALDTSAGIWLAESAQSAKPDTVAALVPASFEAVARVFHPAVRYVGDDDVEVPWASVADANGTVVHPPCSGVPSPARWSTSRTMTRTPSGTALPRAVTSPRPSPSG